MHTVSTQVLHKFFTSRPHDGYEVIQMNREQLEQLARVYVLSGKEQRRQILRQVIESGAGGFRFLTQFVQEA